MQQKQIELKDELRKDREDLKFYEQLLASGKYDSYILKNIIKYYSNEIKQTIIEMTKVGKK